MGRPRLPEGQRREKIAMRWAPATIKALKARGPHWSNWAEEVIKLALTNPNWTAAVKKIKANAEMRLMPVGDVARYPKKRGAK